MLKEMKDMKQMIKYILAVVALALVAPSCNKDFVWEGFGVNNDDSETNCIKITAESGTTTISVYSDSAWSAELEDDYDWVELSNTSGNGRGRITFDYEANNEAIRRAFVLVHSKGETKRIMVLQAGKNIIFRFRAEDGEMSIEKDATTYYLALESNISNDLYKYVVLDEVEYLDLSKDWISNVRMQGEQLAMDVAQNDTGLPRAARLGITFTDPYTKSVYGPSYVSVTQGITSSVEISWETLLERYTEATGGTGSWVVSTVGDEEASGIKISCVSLSGPENSNAAMNTQSSWSGSSFAATDTNVNDGTTYIVSRDQKYSMKVRMLTGKDHIIPQYALAQIRVDGCTLKKNADGRLELSDVRSRNVVSITTGTEQDVVVEERTIAELTPADYYRIVTIKDVELVYNKGALYNTTDGYRYCCDYYPTLLRDKDGNTIYMMFNHKQALDWVRVGNETPLGKGSVKGIITYDTSNRYGENSGTEHNSGGSLGAFVIRPFDEGCLQFEATEEQSFSTTHAEWHWLDEAVTLDAEKKVLPKTGEGRLYHELGAVPTIDNCFNSLQSGTAAAVTITRTACCYNTQWADASGALKGLVVEFSAATLGAGASLNIAYWAGSQSTAGIGLKFPANWHIQYSLDGVNYTTIENSDFDIHPQVWWNAQCPQFATHGLAQRTFLLPAELSGAEKAYLRIAPFTFACATHSHPEASVFTANDTTPLYVAAITIKYNK
jgi:hypothetical protein